MSAVDAPGPGGCPGGLGGLGGCRPGAVPGESRQGSWGPAWGVVGPVTFSPGVVKVQGARRPLSLASQ